MLLQLHVRPYRLRNVNNLQLVAAVCLTLLSILNSAQSAFASVGVSSQQQGPMKMLLLEAEVMMFVLLLPPPLL